jgi:hypothetical protein
MRDSGNMTKPMEEEDSSMRTETSMKETWKIISSTGKGSSLVLVASLTGEWLDNLQHGYGIEKALMAPYTRENFKKVKNTGWANYPGKMEDSSGRTRWMRQGKSCSPREKSTTDNGERTKCRAKE